MRRPLSLVFALSALAGLTAGACDGAKDVPPAETPAVAQSALARDLAPAVPAADLAAAVAGNNAFAFDLYHELAATPGNLIYSPHSVSVALAMAWAGAAGNTAAELAAVMHFDLPAAQQHPAFNALDLALSSRGQGAVGADGQPFRLRVVNAAWAQVGYPFLAPFLDTLALNYGAGVRLLDFAAAAEPARQTINDWVGEQTEGRIPDLLPVGSVDSATRLVLTNAVYFNAAWDLPFDPETTTTGAFTRLADGAVQVPMMHQTEHFAYAAADGWTAVELPYDGGEVAMLAVMADDFATFEAGLDETTLAAIDAALQPTRVALSLPKFEYRTSANLVSPLGQLGVVDAFAPGAADFSAMDGGQSLFISGVLHQAFIKLDEAGTEAAAATAVIIGVTSVPPPPVPVSFDKPFVYVIRDVATGAVLFVGRVVDPSA